MVEFDYERPDKELTSKLIKIIDEGQKAESLKSAAAKTYKQCKLETRRDIEDRQREKQFNEQHNYLD